MLYRFVLYIIGFGLAVSGGVNTIAYLNSLTMGYGFSDYVNFILARPECYLLPVGLIILTMSIYGVDQKK